MITLKNYKGLCFIGDPHIWSKKPGSRTDEDFTKVVLGKLSESLDICKKKKLYPIILGDLFHTDKENDIELLTRLCRILRKTPEPCATVGGNHEISQTELSDDVALSLLAETKSIYVISEGLWACIEINNHKVLICSTPYGKKIPLEFKKPDGFEDATVFWLTHHDLDFGESYPGVIPLHEIKNVDFLVNGHIHKTKPIQKLGEMTAFNPGNIIRLSTDCDNHVPSIWAWTPEQPTFEQIPLTFNKNVFLKIGKQIEVEKSKQLISDEIQPEHVSQFVTQMEHDAANNRDEQKSDDGEHIRKSISALAKAMDIDDEFTKEILSIADETISEFNS